MSTKRRTRLKRIKRNASYRREKRFLGQPYEPFTDEEFAEAFQRSAERRRAAGVDFFGRDCSTATHFFLGAPFWQWEDGSMHQCAEPTKSDRRLDGTPSRRRPGYYD